MHPVTPSSISPEVLSRSIDRFLRAEGWRVTDVVKRADGSGYDVTLTKDTEPNLGQRVTRHASSAGEATLKACSSARLLTLSEPSPTLG
jgi:hypothetical protein